MKVLGIETSCDETAAGVVEDGKILLSNVVASSIDQHILYGGVVPEIAARSHIESILPVIDEALKESACGWDEIDAIAVTQGAGLGGSLLIGVMTARTLAITRKKPLYAINHVAAHIYANFITSTSLPGYTLRKSEPEFPMLAIIVSGGHSQLVLYRAHFDYTVLGRTRDDAIGEAFDKVAKMIGLPYPGGPAIAKLAELGDPYAYRFPKAKMPGLDFSFSGLKTAVLRLAQSEIGESFNFPSIKLPDRLSEAQKQNIAASFQRTAIETIVDNASLACRAHNPKSVVVAGGVAASQELRRQLTAVMQVKVEFPDLKLCTDNGAMVATLGYFQMACGLPAADLYSLAIMPNLMM